jgi:hypothetical protein
MTWHTPPIDVNLFNPLLSAALEWMNILPIHQPAPAVRPRVDIDPAVLKKADNLHHIGIRGSKLASDNALNALANWQLSKIYSDQGNTLAADFFLDG